MIGDAGCEAIEELLQDTNCALRFINLEGNRIGLNGATDIANSLSGNNHLEKILLQDNSTWKGIGLSNIVFERSLCDKTNIDSIYMSNHTLKEMDLGAGLGQRLISLLELNKGTNKSHVEQ